MGQKMKSLKRSKNVVSQGQNTCIEFKTNFYGMKYQDSKNV